MEEVAPPRSLIFNSPLETGIRQLVILEAMYPRPCDLRELTWFDHLIVHSADVGGPPSLHPDTPERSGELAVRREVIMQSLGLMRRAHLIDEVHTDRGVGYLAGDEATIFVDALASDYSKGLKTRAQWLRTEFGEKVAEQIGRVVEEHIGYEAQFLNREQPGSGS